MSLGTSSKKRRITVRRVGFGVALLTGGFFLASAAPAPMPEALPAPYIGAAPAAGEFDVMTFNVKGLPWPIATGRPWALRQIGERLAQLRRDGRQPAVVVLQEAFTPEAKAIGAKGGYAWQVQGPYARTAPGNIDGGSWMAGETQHSVLDSGLMLLSDYPVLSVERTAFLEGDCAGYDCLAAKGVLFVTLDVPGAGPVKVAVTHMNSRKASGVSHERANAAYDRQAAHIGRMLKAHGGSAAPMVFAGDFNRGNRPTRVVALHTAFGRTRDSIVRLAEEGMLSIDASPDIASVNLGARDMQFAIDGRDLRVEPRAVQVLFGTEADGSMLSDHVGYSVRYRLAPGESGASRMASAARVNQRAVTALAARTQPATPARP